MAIAYFIPDQSKLLAGSTGNGSNTSNSHSSNSTGGQNPNQSTATNATAPNMQPHQYQHHHNNNNFRANITIPLSAHYGTAVHHNVGCWDLITQVFCYALRFYHESNTSLNPGFIQISLEISGGSVETPSTATMPPAATQQQQPTATQSGQWPAEGPKKN